jgi:hypothetical protein
MTSNASVKPPHFQQVQYQFAAHLRDPEHQPAPAGIENRRLQIYRELFYNNIEDFLSNAFPVLRKLTADARWHAMARDFYARHQCRDPQFYKISEEFLGYLEHERGAVAGDPPFLKELAHYEWVEMALAIAEIKLTPELGGADTASCASKWEREAPHRPAPASASPRSGSVSLGGADTASCASKWGWEAPHRPAPAPASPRSGSVSLADPNGDLIAGVPVASPLAWTLAYDYPVHRISPEFQPAEPGAQPTCLIVYRTRQDEVKFMEVNAITARLMQLINEQPATGREQLMRVAAELQHPQPEAVIAEGVRILEGLRERDILLGTRR